MPRAAVKLDNATRRRIRRARKTLGLSITAAARLAGVDRTTLYRIEQGRSSHGRRASRGQAPTATTLKRILSALKADTEALALARARVERGTRQHLRDLVPYEADPVTRYVVSAHPDGLEVDQVAEVLGLCATAVDTSQASAVRKLSMLVHARTPEGDAARAWIARIAEAREHRDERVLVEPCPGEDELSIRRRQARAPVGLGQRVEDLLSTRGRCA